MKESIEVVSKLLEDLIAGEFHISTIVSIIVVFISSLFWIIKQILKIIGKNNVIGLEDYETRKKSRFNTCLMFILLFVIATLILSTYNTWITFIIDNYDSKKDNVAILGLLYMCVAVIILVLWLFHLIFMLPKNIRKDMDKYEKNYQTEKIRFGFYIFICFFLLGLTIILQNPIATIIFIFVIFGLGIITLYLPDCESDRALLYIKDADLKKIYIYRTIDNDKLLCGVKKNALSCTSYIVKSKIDVFKNELYLVDKEQKEENIQKNNKEKGKTNESAKNNSKPKDNECDNKERSVNKETKKKNL